jgi:hypothetical protein
MIDETSADGTAAFESRAAAAIRARDFKAATLLFLKAMKGTPFFAPCRRVANEYVGINGWPEAVADLIRLTKKGAAVTALGLDITDHNDGAEPALEVAYYDDKYFRFSGSIEDVRRAASGYGAPWQGSFLDMGEPLIFRGLADVHQAVKSYPHRFKTLRAGEAPPRHYAGFLAANWYLYFRIHHAIERDLKKGALDRPLVVVVAEHDFGPYFGDVYVSEASAKAGQAAARVGAARDKKNLAAYDRITAELLDELRRRRRDIRGWPEAHNGDKRQAYIDYVEASEAMRLSILDLPSTTPSWKMNDAEFRRLLATVKAAREARKRKAA